MAKADEFRDVGALIEAADAQGWGVAFDRNRHGQWRVLRIVDGQIIEVIADSSCSVACRVAIDEIERLANSSEADDATADGELQLVHPQRLAAPQQLASPQG